MPFADSSQSQLAWTTCLSLTWPQVYHNTPCLSHVPSPSLALSVSPAHLLPTTLPLTHSLPSQVFPFALTLFSSTSPSYAWVFPLFLVLLLSGLRLLVRSLKTFSFRFCLLVFHRFIIITCTCRLACARPSYLILFSVSYALLPCRSYAFPVHLLAFGHALAIYRAPSSYDYSFSPCAVLPSLTHTLVFDMSFARLLLTSLFALAPQDWQLAWGVGTLGKLLQQARCAAVHCFMGACIVVVEPALQHCCLCRAVSRSLRVRQPPS